MKRTITRSLASYSPTLEKMQKLVNSRRFDLMSDFILAIFVLIFFASDALRLCYRQIGINSVEVLLRVTLRDTSNFSEWFRSPRNFANICYISLLLLLSIIYFSYCGVYGTLRFTAVCTDKALNRNIFYYWDSRVLFAIMAIRALILFVLYSFYAIFVVYYRNGKNELLRAYDIVAETSLSLRHLVLMVVVVMYCFAAFGQMAFGGKLNKNPASPTYEKLMQSTYADEGYWPLNFNDMPSGLVSVFTLLYVNNMDILASGCVTVTGLGSDISSYSGS